MTMTQEEIIKMELEHFYNERKKVQNEFILAKKNNNPHEIRRNFEKMVMIDEIIEAKKEKLNNKDNSTINDLIAKDIIRLIDRVELAKCKGYLKELGVKGYSKLNTREIRGTLVDILRKMPNNEYALNIYNENKVRLDMFKYEVCETLELSKYRFDKDIDNFTVSGVQSVRAGGKTQQCNKYCRREVYKKMLEG